VERELLEQSGQIATLVECFAWLQRCDECIERLKELCHASASAPRHWTQTIRGGDLRVQNRNWSDGSMHVDGEYAIGDERFPVWR